MDYGSFKIRKSFMIGNLELWLQKHYYQRESLLDLEPREICDDMVVSTGGGVIFISNCVEDPRYRLYVPLFMQNPNAFLDAYDVKKLNLTDDIYKWDIKYGLNELANNTTLTHLYLSGNAIHDDDAAIIANNKILKVLDLGSNYIKSPGPILKMENVTSLCLNYNFITDDEAAVFSDNKILDALYVRANKLGPTSAKEIAKIASLKELNISHNSIRDEGSIALITQLKELHGINLKKTKIGKKTAQELLKHPNLTEIHVSLCEVGCVNKWRLWRFAKKNAATQNTPKTGKVSNAQFFAQSSHAFFHKKKKSTLTSTQENNQQSKKSLCR